MQKRYFFAVMLVIAVLALVPAVSAVYSTPPTESEVRSQWSGYQTWLSKAVFQGYAYTDTLVPVGTPAEKIAWCAKLNRSLTSQQGNATLHVSGTGYISGLENRLTPRYGGTNYAVYFDYNPECSSTPYGHYWWIGYSSKAPISYNLPNLTITAKSASSGMTIPRAEVTVVLTSSPYHDIRGNTDLNGEIIFSKLESTSENSNKTITVSKVGYNTSVSYVNLTENTEISVYLDDAAWDTSGTKAVVYLDIIDESTSAAISGATIGIKNTTNEINPWYYNTYSDSTIAFTTDGTNDLSVGQTIEFAGYKSGSYAAGHTDPISILAPVTRTSLKLTKSDVVDPLDIVNGSFYWYPVTVVDSVSGNAISGSSLNYQVTDDLYWINKTSATGKFNMTGKGMMGLFPFENGDTIVLEGNASGYIRGGFALGVDSDNSGVTQFVSLVPSSYQATTGEWTAVLLAYDDDSTAALSGVSIQLKNATSRWSKTTTSSGSATFTGLISDDSYTLTASKSGYTTATKTITGWSTGIVSVDVPMSKLSTNPTVTTTQTPLPGETSPPANDDVIAGWMRTRSIELLDFFYFFIILGSLGILLKMFNLV